MFKRRERFAASGAAQTPPKINPTIVCQCDAPKIVKKVNELASETKNSAKLTEPTTSLGLLQSVWSFQ